MGYTKVGYRIVPEAVYIPEYARTLLNAHFQDLEVVTSEAFEKLGRGSRRLTSLIFEDILQIQTPTFPVNSVERRQFLHLVIKTLNHMGYIDESVPIYELRKDAILSIDDAAAQMLAARMKWYTKEDVGSEYATIDNFKAIFPSAVRLYSFVATERKEMVKRLRTYLGTIGYKLMAGGTLTQHEKTLFACYQSTLEGSPGFSDEVDSPPQPIRAQENQDPLVLEAFELYKQYTEPGPCLRFIQLKSDTNMERLTMYIGMLPSEIGFYTGYMQPYGPFSYPIMEQVELMKWSTAEQLLGITDGGDYFQVQVHEGGLLTIRPPRVMTTWQDNAMRTFVLDTPDIVYNLRDESDITHCNWQYFSPWRNRPLNNMSSAITADDYIVDLGLKHADAGGILVENYSLANTEISDFSHETVSGAFVRSEDSHLVERIYLPAADGRRLETRTVDTTDLFIKRGTIQTRTAFGSLVRPSRTWFSNEDQNAVAFISTRLGLTIDEQTRFGKIINIAHNAARYERLTGQPPEFDVREYCAHVGGYTI
jgi:hypothetical protein